MEQLGWIFVVFSFIGYWLNVKKNKFCFIFWLACSGWWFVYNFLNGMYPLAVNFAMYFCFELWGLIRWVKEDCASVGAENKIKGKR